MPTIFKSNGYRFFFYSNDHLPRHVHVEKAKNVCKFELDPLALIRNTGFKASELREILI
ncbi:MAG: hypothetical protein B7Z16_09555 [Algoriphagus sp. 32-45-6]|nr:MAG: hypothetical protein B7Z16_09555 [Algoriphagus sp. 32-45-6]